MKLCIRAHDLGVKGTEPILHRLAQLGLDGAQMVCYKAYEDIPYQPGAITPEKAGEIGAAFSRAGASIPLIGAYFNCVHSRAEKRERGFQVFADYLRVARTMGCGAVGSETGSYSDDPWVYHPQNRTEEAVQAVVSTFSRLCDIAEDFGVEVAMEGAAGHVCWNVDTLERAQRMMGRKNARVIFDLYNYLDDSNQGDYMSILEKGLDTFGDRILLFHMKDCRFDGASGPVQVPFGRGELDLNGILGRIKANNPNAVLTLEGTTGEDILPAVRIINGIWERV